MSSKSKSCGASNVQKNAGKIKQEMTSRGHIEDPCKGPRSVSVLKYLIIQPPCVIAGLVVKCQVVVKCLVLLKNELIYHSYTEKFKNGFQFFLPLYSYTT